MVVIIVFTFIINNYRAVHVLKGKFLFECLSSEKHFISFKVYDEKRKLITGSFVKNKYPSKIIIHCKDLRVFQFCLTFTKEEDTKKVICLTRGLKWMHV